MEQNSREQNLKSMIEQADEWVLAGRYREAQAHCERVLAEQPDHLHALCILGNACLLQGDYTAAYEHFMMAATLGAERFEVHIGLGLATQNLGIPAEALMHFRRAHTIQPDSVEVLRLIGASLQETGRAAEAQQAYQQAAALERPPTGGRPRQKPSPKPAQRRSSPIPPPPAYAPWQETLQQGMTLVAQMRYRDAVPILQQVIARKADLPEAYLQLSYALYRLNEVAAAEACCRKGLATVPHNAQLYNNLGMLVMEQGRPEEAVDSYIQANMLDPKLLAVYSNLGIALYRLGRVEEAEVISRAGLELDPGREALQHTLGLILNAQNRDVEASNVLQQALMQHPNNPDIAFDLALIQLKQGDFAAGWRGLEMRRSNRDRMFRQPRWQGESLRDKTILVWAEQGLGDTIQFVRYLPMVKAYGGRVILQHQPELGTLLQTVDGCDELTPLKAGGQQPTLPFDVQIGLWSLPRIFHTDLHTIPAQIPYLHADPVREQHWRQRLQADAPEMRVGIVWAGSKDYVNDAFRSCRLADFAPLAEISGLRLYSLQTGEPAQQVSDLAGAMKLMKMQLTDLSPELHDFADTAAAIMNLDLVISVDTSVAHLAGALGRPVWTLVISRSEWRWLKAREDTPWYPTMRLFRQRNLGDWSDVMTAVCRQLQAETNR